MQDNDGKRFTGITSEAEMVERLFGVKDHGAMRGDSVQIVVIRWLFKTSLRWWIEENSRSLPLPLSTRVSRSVSGWDDAFSFAVSL